MSASAWIEPGTASLCLYCSTLLLRGWVGARMLSRNLKRGRETLADIALEEFGDFLCDHPDAMLTVMLLSASVLPGPDGAPRCRLVARAPALLRSPRTLVRSSRTLTRAAFGSVSDRFHRIGDEQLHLLQRVDPAPGIRSVLQQAQANPDEPGAVRRRPLPANPSRLPVLLRRAGRGKGPPLRLLCQLAATVVGRWAKKAGQEASTASGPRRGIHAAAGNRPVP